MEWKVKIEDSLEGFNKKVFVYRNLFDGGIEILKSDFKGSFIYSAGERSDVKPTLHIPYDVFNALVMATRESRVSIEGKFTEGKLEATTKHLEDMRRLVFEEKMEITGVSKL